MNRFTYSLYDYNLRISKGANVFRNSGLNLVQTVSQQLQLLGYLTMLYQLQTLCSDP
jgi:hypothetical protein